MFKGSANSSARARYRPFGEVDIDEDPDGDGRNVVNNIRYPGQYEDGLTGDLLGENLYYNVMRYYDPGMGRYMTPERGDWASGIDVNRYYYAAGNPLRYIDLFGLYFSEIEKFIEHLLNDLKLTPSGRDLIERSEEARAYGVNLSCRALPKGLSGIFLAANPFTAESKCHAIVDLNKHEYEVVISKLAHELKHYLNFLVGEEGEILTTMLEKQVLHEYRLLGGNPWFPSRQSYLPE